MDGRICKRMLAVVTILAWTVLVLDAIFLKVPADVERLAVAVAVAGSVFIAVRERSRPVSEVFQMGVDAGRRQAKIDAATERVSRSGVVIPFRRAAE